MYTTEEFREQVYLWYDTNGITVGDPNEGNWERAHIVPQCVGGTETVLLLHGHHCYHDLIQSKEYNRQCFFAGTTRAWLYGEGFLCENWFELVEIYEHYLTLNLSRTASATQKAYWEALTPEQRSAETSRRTTLQWSSKTAEERRAQTAAGAAAAGKALSAMWSSMTPEERSAEMSRRQAVRWARVRAERALRSLGDELHGALWADDTL